MLELRPLPQSHDLFVLWEIAKPLVSNGGKLRRDSCKGLIAWSEQAKALAQQSLSAGLQAAQQSTALLLEEAARMNAAAVRQAFEEGVARMEQALAAGRRIAWLSLTASVVALDSLTETTRLSR